jgi:hypothetical protein
MGDAILLENGVEQGSEPARSKVSRDEVGWTHGSQKKFKENRCQKIHSIPASTLEMLAKTLLELVHPHSRSVGGTRNLINNNS